MNRPLVLVTAACASLLLGITCPRALPPVEVAPTGRSLAFVEDVKPILDARCVVCHSCYNAPCQLQLGSFEGLDRGGSKDAVYSSSRLHAAAPSRLGVDAASTEGWRERGFFSVTDNPVQGALNDSVMLHLLAAKLSTPEPDGAYQPESAGLSCPEDAREVSRFLSRSPAGGMPFGFPGLTSDQYQTLAGWLQQGGGGPSAAQQAKLVSPSSAVAREIAKWESFLNRDDPKHVMTARYLYEHFFLAHMAFRGASSREFYRLVRATTPAGEPIAVIATRRPYDDPGVDRFFYRFQKIHETLVQKTHMVVEVDDRALARYRELFIESEWLEAPRVVGRGEFLDANPFLVYAQIPPDSRYRFLLDHSEYIIRTFIRGPVCHGQVALDVIHDHFWVMFRDPDSDLAVQHPQFLIEQAENLRLPNEKGSDEKFLRTFSNRYRDRYLAFGKAKAAFYGELEPEGASLDAIWRGRRSADGPFLTVYRHFDSASVHKGALGDLPRTAWVIDYSQLERIYYALVAGFDVYGNVAHQVNVRRYMDYLRAEGELNFLRFLPRETRLPTFESWYQGSRAIDHMGPADVVSDLPTRVIYQSSDPKREFITKVVKEHILPSTGIAFDPINYSGDGLTPAMPTSFRTRADFLTGLRALTAPGTGFIRHVNSSAMNVLYVRVRDFEGADQFFSLVINRWHDNVDSMFREKSRLNPAKDTIDFFRGSMGAYPNYFLDVAGDELPGLFDLLENFDGSEEAVARFDGFGVNRADPRFWQLYDWFQARFDEAEPVYGGLYDLNRYYPVADSD